MKREDGFILPLALTLLIVIGLILATYAFISINNVKTGASGAAASAGFYASEASLNARAEQIRNKFVGFETPVGVSPTSPDPCGSASNQGSGDFGCKTDVVAGRNVKSYVVKGGTEYIKIPPGENFANLSAEETAFTVSAKALGANGNPEALTNLIFRSRLVPLFQFAMFFDKDLEFSNTASLNLAGPVHTNGNLFLDAGTNATLNINGQVTAAQSLYRGWKHSNNCLGTVNIANAAGVMIEAPCLGTSRSEITNVTPWTGQLKGNIGALQVPSAAQLQPQQGAQYWDKADARIVLRRNSAVAGGWEVRFATPTGTLYSAPASACAGLTTSQTLFDNREAQYWESTTLGNVPANAKRRTLDVNVPSFLDCLQTNAGTLGISDGLANKTEGGLVLFLTVDDSLSTTMIGTPAGAYPALTGVRSQSTPPVPNNYAIRLYNGASLRGATSTVIPKGITFVSDQAVFVQGNYNSVAANKIPAAIMADTINVLSSNWTTNSPCTYRANNTDYYMTPNNVGNSGLVTTGTFRGTTWRQYKTSNTAAAYTPPAAPDGKSLLPLWCRPATPTTINAAVLSATTTSGTTTTVNGEGTLDQGPQSGGVHNMMRFHEEWGANSNLWSATVIPFTYLGSLVSLNQPFHAIGNFMIGQDFTANYGFYNPPLRVWGFDTTFRDAGQLPPLAPRFVYIKQDNFVRNFSQ